MKKIFNWGLGPIPNPHINSFYYLFFLTNNFKLNKICKKNNKYIINDNHKQRI